MRAKNQGFTLLELSIVLTVIALLFGGVLVGRSVMRNAQLQNVASDFANYKQAIEQFNEKYKALPGDMTNATTIWGVDTLNCVDTNVSGTLKTVTCDGNGDGMIANYSNSPQLISSSTANGSYEAMRAWQQLANAGFIPGIYSGAGGSGGTFWYRPGFNIPAGRISAANGFSLSYSDRIISTSAAAFPGNYKHVIVYGKAQGNLITNTASAAGLSGQDALTIDSKIDDGRPGQGTVRSFTQNSTTTTCTDSNVAETAKYVVASDIPTCALIYITGF